MISKDEQFQDWFFRYRYIYRKRRTNKNKQRFLSALTTDLSKLREDVQVIAYNTKQYCSSSVYVGDIEQADKIICTYYDTPPNHFGPYLLFDRKAQQQRTLAALLFGLVLLIGMGLAGLSYYMTQVAGHFAFASIQTVLAIVVFGSYFWLFGKMAQGLSSRQTLARNTSSLLTMLTMIKEVKDESIAYAFIDDGCFGEAGLEIIKQTARKNSPVFFLDSVGANAPLHFAGNYFSKQANTTLAENPAFSKNLSVNYIFSAEVKEQKQTPIYFLSKKVLKQNTFNYHHLDKVIQAFR